MLHGAFVSAQIQGPLADPGVAYCEERDTAGQSNSHANPLFASTFCIQASCLASQFFHLVSVVLLGKPSYVHFTLFTTLSGCSTRSEATSSAAQENILEDHTCTTPWRICPILKQCINRAGQSLTGEIWLSGFNQPPWKSWIWLRSYGPKNNSSIHWLVHKHNLCIFAN